MSGGGDKVHTPAKPRNVHSAKTERPQSRPFKHNEQAYTQVYLARARIEGIEKWRVAVDAALQAAEEDGEQLNETNSERQITITEAEDETLKEEIDGEVAQDDHVELAVQPTMVEGTKLKRRSRRYELWKGFRNMFFVF